MKRIWKTAVFLLCLFFVTACSTPEETGTESSDAISVYYINKAETKIRPVEHILESEALSGQIEETVEALKQNPVELSLRTPVNGYQIQEWTVQDGQLVLDVSREYQKIEPTTEVLLRAAIVRTMTQLNGIDHVMITVDGQALVDNLGMTVGSMTADMFIDNAGNEINAYETAQLNLYFANKSGDGLVHVLTDPIAYNSNIAMEKVVVENLIKGPAKSEEFYPVINPETKILGVTVKDGTCYVNLDSGFLTQLYNVTADVAIYSIVNSLAELPNVHKVQIAVNGETNMMYRETFDLAKLYERNLNLVYNTEE